MNKNISEFLLPNGEWDLDKLKRLLPEGISDWIVAAFPRKRENGEDEIQWNHNNEGEFTVKSAYNIIAREERLCTGRLGDFIWKWPGQQRCRTFMWLCAHNKILTNKQREKRKYTMDALCDFYRSMEELVIHALRDCLAIIDLWKMLIKPRY